MMLTSGPLEIVLPAMLLAMCVCAHAQEAEMKPRVIQTKYPAEDIVVALAVATEAPFNAVADGTNDCTAAIQAAIDAVAKAGGGVVFLPEGRYLCKGNLLRRIRDGPPLSTKAFSIGQMIEDEDEDDDEDEGLARGADGGDRDAATA
jgi:hypothetical protein